MSDMSLRQDVVDESEFEPSLDAANIGVAVENSVVTLTGHVRNYMDELKAEEAVRHVKGVHGLAQELEVRYPGHKQTSDDEIAQRALHIISWDTTIPHNKVQVRIEKGWVALMGKVDWYYQKSAAENAVHRLSGIKGISNQLAVEPHVWTGRYAAENAAWAAWCDDGR